MPDSCPYNFDMIIPAGSFLPVAGSGQPGSPIAINAIYTKNHPTWILKKDCVNAFQYEVGPNVNPDDPLNFPYNTINGIWTRPGPLPIYVTLEITNCCFPEDIANNKIGTLTISTTGWSGNLWISHFKGKINCQKDKNSTLKFIGSNKPPFSHNNPYANPKKNYFGKYKQIIVTARTATFTGSDCP